MTTGVLDRVALRQFTGKVWRSAQRAKLRERGIPFQVDGDETVVLWKHVEAWVEGRPTAVSSWQPRFDQAF